jgi:capsular exopolysaccharide synthesis family protein
MSNSDGKSNKLEDQQVAPPLVALNGASPLAGPDAPPIRRVISQRHSASPAAKPSSPNHALILLRALRRRWLVAITLGSLVAAGIAAAIWFFLPPEKQTAYVKLYMPKKVPGVLYTHPEEVSEFTVYQQTQLALMKGRMVMNLALNNPKVKALNLEAITTSLAPVDWLEKEIRVTTPDGPELPRISMIGDKPEQLKILVDAVVEAYLKEVIDKGRVRRQEHIDQLKEIATKYEATHRRLVDARNQTAKAVGTSDNRVIALKQELAQKELSVAQAELFKVNAELRRMELEVKTYQGAQSGSVEIPDNLIDSYIDKDLVKEIAIRDQLEARLAATRRVLDNDQHPKILSLLDDIAAQKKAIAARRKELRPQYKEQLKEKAQNDTQARLINLKDQVRFYKEFQSNLDKEVTRLDAASRDLNGKSLVIEGYSVEIQLAEAGVARVRSEIDKETVEQPDPPRVTRLDKEVVVVTNDEVARKVKVAGLGAFGGFGVVLLLLALVEVRSRRIDSFEEVGQGLGLQLMGTLPAARKRIRRGMTGSSASHAAEAQSRLADSINSVRTVVLHAANPDSLRVLMVTSATSGEGKTSLATHLAASLARAGHKTLLLDGDLRKPAAHRVFDLPPCPGFSEFLRGEVEPAEAIRPTLVGDLNLMPAGECDGAAIELLARGGIPSLLEKLKPEFDYIVIDSSPVLPVADSLLLAQHADGVLLSLFHEVSRFPLVHAAYQKLSMIGVRMLGAVINGTHDDSYGYGKYSLTVKKS